MASYRWCRGNHDIEVSRGPKDLAIRSDFTTTAPLKSNLQETFFPTSRKMSPNGSSSSSDKHKSDDIPKLRVRAATNDFPSPQPEDITGQFSHFAISSSSKSSVSLDKRLRRISVRHAFGTTFSFWPPPMWQALVTEQTIVEELLGLNKGFNRRTASTLAKKISLLGSERRLTVFTILVLSDNLDAVDHILQNCKHGGIRDKDLPLVLRQNSWGDEELIHHNGNQVAPCCLGSWKAVKLELFSDFQRRLSPPIFGLKQDDNTLIHLDLDDQAILPWCEVKENLVSLDVMSGGFGTVSRVKIHPLCHRFSDTLKAVC